MQKMPTSCKKQMSKWDVEGHVEGDMSSHVGGSHMAMYVSSSRDHNITFTSSLKII